MRKRAQARLEALNIWSWQENDVPRTIQQDRDETTRELFKKLCVEERAKIEAEATSNGAAGGTKRGRDDEEDGDAKRAKA